MALSRFAGQYRAVEFNYGGAPTTAPAPLVVVSAPGTTGVQTLTVQNGWITLSDGTVVSPLATTAPIIVGSAGNQDSATPSAVSNNVQSNTYGPTSTVTATLTHAHYSGDRISSGTYGLQEAINYANSVGGGTVIIDNAWVTAGGTTAILNAATLPSNGTVQIMDLRGGQGTPVIVSSFTVTSAQIKTLNSVPTSLIPAPGAGNMIDIVDAVIQNNYGTAAYASGGVIQLSYGTGTTTPASATIAATFLTSPTAKQMIKVAGALASSLSSAVVNTAIYIACATGDFTTGDGTLTVKIAYRVLTGF